MSTTAFFGSLQDVPDQPPAPLATGGETAAKRLPLVMEPQGPSRWCWAATTASVATFYATYHNVGQPLTQCEVASLCMAPQECCPPPKDPNDSRNCEFGLDVALLQVGHRNGSAIEGSISFGQIKTEIDAERPICCHIKWNDSVPGDNGHFIAVVGYDESKNAVDVLDCLKGSWTGPYDVLRTRYLDAGSWDGTYLTS
jgi:hypothetical protein